MVIFNSYVKLPEGMISVDPQISFRHRPCTLGLDIHQCHQPKFLELDLPPWGFRMFAVTRALSLEGEQSFLDNMCMIVYVYIYIRLLCIYIYTCRHVSYIYVCVYTANNMQSKYWFGRGVRHDCGTALNEATTIMGYWVWSTQRTCIRG